MKRLAETGHVFQHLLLLVDFDRIDPAIVALIARIANRLVKRVVDPGDLVAQDIRKPQQDRYLQPAVFEL